MVGHRIPSNGDVRQARRDCRSCEMWGRHIYTCACARRQRCIRVHTNRHVSPPHRPTSPYGHRARYAVRCTTHVPCMRTTHGSSDLPSEIMGDTGGTGHWYFGANPKPPPPPLAHTGGSASWTPATFLSLLLRVRPTTKNCRGSGCRRGQGIEVPDHKDTALAPAQ